MAWSINIGYMAEAKAPLFVVLSVALLNWYGGFPMITSNCMSLWNISLIDLWIKG